MAIYRIDNVERSGIGQYGKAIWNFPEAYNDAKDGDVLEIQSNVIVDLNSYQPYYSSNFVSNEQCSLLFYISKRITIKGTTGSGILGFFYVDNTSVVLKDISIGSQGYESIYHSSVCEFDNVSFIKTSKDEYGSVEFQESTAKINNCWFNEDYSMGSTQGLVVDNSKLEISNTSFFARTNIMNNSEVSFNNCFQCASGQTWCDFVVNNSAIELTDSRICLPETLPEHVEAGDKYFVNLKQCKFNMINTVIEGSMYIE
ncbi:hypothetical protein [Lactobacillus equicursoris]|uniref:hypothetical protein n=1 Tax=Lactobacillus equicursoris TaxID=420645 RepID=UPI0039953281